MRTRVYVDGQLSAPEEARIRVLDHGVLFGDSVYEVFWWHRGTLIQAPEHFERLEGSAQRLSMELQHDRAFFERAIAATLQAAEAGPEDEAYVRLIVTRGVGPLGLDVAEVVRRGVVVIVAPAMRPDAATFERGLSVDVVERRRTSARALDPRAKTGNYLNNVLALLEAKRGGADDALMFNEQGELTEATTSNVYLVERGVLSTPRLEAGILEGTTRRRLLALAVAAGVPVRETALASADLERAEEAFVSSSVRGVLPITRLAGRVVGDGRPGPATRRLHRLFEAAADQEAGLVAAPRPVPA